MSRSDVSADLSRTMALNVLANAVQDEDTAHTSGDKGLVLMAVRKDTAAALAGTDGDYIPFTTDSLGRVRIAPLPAASGVDIGDVDVASIAAGETHLGAVGGHTIAAIVTPTLTTGASYAANDYVGTDHTPMSFTLARVNAGSGVIIGATLIDYAIASVAAELWLFSATLDPGHDSAAWTITDAESLTCIGVIPFSTYYASANNSVATGSIPNGGLPFVCGAGSKVVFGCLVTRGAPAYTNGLVSVRLVAVAD